MTTDYLTGDAKRNAIKFCGGLFEVRNLIANDFDNVQVTKVSGGLQVTFVVGWEAIGRSSEEARKTLGQLIPDDDG